jgi:hypothetical protein
MARTSGRLRSSELRRSAGETPGAAGQPAIQTARARSGRDMGIRRPCYQAGGEWQGPASPSARGGWIRPGPAVTSTRTERSPVPSGRATDERALPGARRGDDKGALTAERGLGFGPGAGIAHVLVRSRDVAGHNARCLADRHVVPHRPVAPAAAGADHLGARDRARQRRRSARSRPSDSQQPGGSPAGARTPQPPSAIRTAAARRERWNSSFIAAMISPGRGSEDAAPASRTIGAPAPAWCTA